jgi:hypothetical protein
LDPGRGERFRVFLWVHAAQFFSALARGAVGYAKVLALVVNYVKNFLLALLESSAPGDLADLRSDLTGLKLENRQEHQQLRQMIQELDTEVVELKRVK